MSGDACQIVHVEQDHDDYTFVVERRDGRVHTFKKLLGSYPDQGPEAISPSELPSEYLMAAYTEFIRPPEVTV